MGVLALSFEIVKLKNPLLVMEGDFRWNSPSPLENLFCHLHLVNPCDDRLPITAVTRSQWLSAEDIPSGGAGGGGVVVPGSGDSGISGLRVIV